MFFANDWITIPSSTARDALYASMTGQNGPGRQVSNIAILSKGGTFVYRVGSYDPAAKRIANVDIVERNAAGQASLQDPLSPGHLGRGSMEFQGGADFFRQGKRGMDGDENEGIFSARAQRGSRFLRHHTGKARSHEDGRTSGLFIYQCPRKIGPAFGRSANRAAKNVFSFLLTPLIVCGLSVSFAGLFRKNSLLMSLPFSLATATVYNVAQMLGALSAKDGMALSRPWRVERIDRLSRRVRDRVLESPDLDVETKP